MLDLSDTIADRLHQPIAAVSVEITYRSLYFATQALHRGQTNDPVAHLAGQARQPGILKQPRKSRPHVAQLEFVANLLQEPVANL